MKRIVFVFLAILPVVCFAQSKKSLSHFWDIPWGTSLEQVESVLLERGVDFSREGDCLIAQARYEGEDAAIVFLFNRVSRFYCGNVVYSSSSAAAIPKYNDCRKILFRRYGMPNTAVEYFEDPYKKGDGREIEAIRTENAFYFTEWQFGDDCLASIAILKSLEVCLTFKNPVYADSALGRR